jgi:hypothetical protein
MKTDDTFANDILASSDAPKWIEPFRKRFYERGILPFLIVYQASAIARKKESKLYRDKGAAIAIATDNLQKAGYLFPETNTLTALGEMHEIAVMRKLGKKKTEQRIRSFEEL